jgi:hypothetical protein
MMQVPLKNKSRREGDLFPVLFTLVVSLRFGMRAAPVLTLSFVTTSKFFGNNFTICASYIIECSPPGRAMGVFALSKTHKRKDKFTMKKLLALLVISGLLTMITGCPPATTTATKKEMPKTGTTEKKEEKKSGGEPKKEEKEEKKTEEKKPGGGEVKKEEKKEEQKKK